MAKMISKCRICGNQHLIPVIDLGEQCLTGVFPATKDQKITSGPLELVKCMSKNSTKCCGLVQLRHSYDSNELYGDNYGYRSSLNNSMVQHLKKIVDENINLAKPADCDLIIDIGSNDGTTLNMYPEQFKLVGIDPTAKKFRSFYKPHIRVIPEFFSSSLVTNLFGTQKAKIVTSIAMFYDLETPIDFAKQITKILDDDGIWVSEQSYLSAMLEQNAYDTICHEHLEYYALKQLKWIFDACELKIIDIDFNDTNGGSIKITAAKRQSNYYECTEEIEKTLQRESKMGLDTMKPFNILSDNIKKHKIELTSLLKSLDKQGKKVLGYGASTKGNVILQYCGITSKDIPYIAEVNEDKFGKYTPHTLIPIISEAEAKAMNPDYFLVLPWHFREPVLKRETSYLNNGGKIIFPLPNIVIIESSGLQ
ncbi:MAG TPA: methyltransferase [Dehalococcoidia bacterium]|nr:methyltransferase [Dehalococcoidia bacterium]